MSRWGAGVEGSHPPKRAPSFAYPMAGYNASYVIGKLSSQLDHTVALPC